MRKRPLSEETDMTEPKFLYLTTTGHRSGKPHEIEIWYVEHDGRFYIISEKREAAHWVRNIRAKATVRFRLGDTMSDAADPDLVAGRGAAPTDENLIAAVKAKMDAKHGWSNGLVVEIAPLD